MNVNYKNTLKLIGKMSQSSSGYILKINAGSTKVLSSFGEPDSNYKPFNDSILKLYQQGEININKLKNLDAYKKLSKKFMWNNLFVKNILTNKSKNLDYYLLLFADSQNSFKPEKVKAVLPSIDDLSNQIKSGEFSNQPKSIDEPKEKKDKNDFLSENLDHFFNILLEASEDLIFILDQHGCFIKLNDFGAASLDFDTEELIGQHFIELVSSKDKSNFAESIQKIIETEKLQLFETTLISKFGNEVIFEISGKSFYKNGSICGIVGVGKNISEIKNFETKLSELNTKLIEKDRIISLERQRSQRQKSILAELNRMKSEFVSNISHELRTPLASIIGFSETISSDPNMPDEMKLEFIEIILNEGKRLAKLINDILDISRIETGEVEIIKTEFDIIELINEILDANKKYFDDKNITLTKELPTESIILKGDKEKIAKVIGGILNNSLKFTNIRGRITVIAQTLYKEFEISITDSGVGIPEKDLPFIFQKFYKVSRPGTELPGTGLGLVFAKQIIDLHKGFISIQSGINKGTTVILKLPR